MKNFKNIVSISVLIIILCALIVTVTTLSGANNLSTSESGGNTQHNVTTEKNFSYVNSKTSLNQNVSFENNFGGSENDQVHEVFKLNNYYLIGTSQSTNYYFSSTKTHSVFVLICDYSGNPLNCFTYESNQTITYLKSSLFRNSIYILVNSNGTKLLEFNLSENKFEIKYSSTNTNSDLVISNEPIIVCLTNTETQFNFVTSNATYTYPNKIINIVMGCEYLNGTLLMYNTLNGFEIGLLTTANLTTLKNYNNYTLNKINVTDKNFVLEVNNATQQKILMLDLTFNLENELNFSLSDKTELKFFNNMHYLFYLNNGNLNITAFCNHGDKLINLTLDSNVKNFEVLLLNNNFIVLSEKTDKSLNLQNVNIIGEVINNTQIVFNANIDVVSFTENNLNNFFIVGNFNQVNQIISNNYGKTDMFVCELNF